MALSENELAVLLSLLQDEQLEKRTFKYLGQALQNNFAKQNHFCVSCDLYIWLGVTVLRLRLQQCKTISRFVPENTSEPNVQLLTRALGGPKRALLIQQSYLISGPCQRIVTLNFLY